MRKMASIQIIRDITPIEGADAIVLAHVNGWSAVVKKDEFQIGQPVVFCEIDSWIPHEIAPFLSKGKEPREYLGVKGERLRTVRLRGQLSQGLILPLSVVKVEDYSEKNEGDEVSELLGIVKYEPPVPAQLSGQVRGNFPSLVTKTDEERVQNIKGLVDKLDELFVETEKLHGTSVSFILNQEGEVEVCSRNLSLKEDENNFYWKLAKKVDAVSLLHLVKDYYNLPNGCVVAIQGEGVGQGVQKGWEYGIQDPDFFLFTIQVNGARIPETDFGMLAAKFKEVGVKSVPTIFAAKSLREVVGDCLTNEEVQTKLLKYVEGKSALDGKTVREGSVFRCLTDSSFSFKVVSNQFLLKGGD